jgi:hypothetical protein
MGVRTLRWKAVFTPGRRPRLFDLARDPGEHTDVAIHHPLVVAGLRALLVDEVRRAEARGTLAEPGAVSEEERELLEALGYS